jgi:hypothetical protein
MPKKTAQELRLEAKRLLNIAKEVERKERVEKVFRVYDAIERYLHDNPAVTHVPVEVINQARRQ